MGGCRTHSVCALLLVLWVLLPDWLFRCAGRPGTKNVTFKEAPEAHEKLEAVQGALCRVRTFPEAPVVCPASKDFARLKKLVALTVSVCEICLDQRMGLVVKPRAMRIVCVLYVFPTMAIPG